MNVIQPQFGLSEKTHGSKNNVNLVNNQSVDFSKKTEDLDRVVKTSGKDEIVAKILTNTLGQTIVAENQVAKNHSSQLDLKLNKHDRDIKLDSVLPEQKQFSTEQVASNVTNFVINALTKFVHNGYSEEQVNFFKHEAIHGVEYGIEQAKKELEGLVSNEVFDLVDSTKNKIISGIDEFAVRDEISRFNSIEDSSESTPSTTFSILSNTEQVIQVSFDSQAIAHDKLDGNLHSITTSASNSLVSFSSANTPGLVSEIADLVNKTDDVLNTFYRKNIEGAYEKAIKLGYSAEELVAQSKQSETGKIAKQVEQYDQIKHFIDKNNTVNYEAPKAVAEYINKYMNVLQSSNELLSGKEDFNQIINGLVNQMKDVQVPDLLHAINKFHSFNKNLDL